jgi:two-component system, LuxR family, sensor kinase FixL
MLNLQRRVAPAVSSLSEWPRRALQALVYVAAYVALDHLSYFHALPGTQITPWSPEIAWLVCIVVRFGLAAAPLTIVTPWLAEVVLGHASTLDIQATATVVSIGCVYTVAGLILRRCAQSRPLETAAGFTMLLLVIVISALTNALTYTGALIMSGRIATNGFRAAATTSWVGDVNGIITWLPLMLIASSGAHETLSEMRHRLPLLLLQCLALLATFWIVFFAAGAGHLNVFYLLFMPITWFALQWGMAVTSLALCLLQLGVAVWVAPVSTPESFIAIQLLMVALAGFGQFLAIASSESARMQQTVRSQHEQLANLRQQAAVTELNAAIAHELNNPLGAMLNYLGSANIQLKSAEVSREKVMETLDKAVGEATRSADVLRKLRAFYRTGAAQKRTLDVRSVTSEAIARFQSDAPKGAPRISLVAEPNLPAVSADPLQLSVILQNLIGNAFDAAGAAGQGKVLVSIRREDSAVIFRIDDNGPGVPESLRETIFHMVGSSKPGGLGLGLAICRSLVESNQGKIWLAPSPAGASFAFSIPVAPQVAASADA